MYIRTFVRGIHYTQTHHWQHTGRHNWFYYTSKQSVPSQMTSHDINTLQNHWACNMRSDTLTISCMHVWFLCDHMHTCTYSRSYSCLRTVSEGSSTALAKEKIESGHVPKEYMAKWVAAHIFYTCAHLCVYIYIVWIVALHLYMHAPSTEITHACVHAHNQAPTCAVGRTMCVCAYECTYVYMRMRPYIRSRCRYVCRIVHVYVCVYARI